MHNPFFAEIAVGSVIIGCALIALIAIITVACIIKYDIDAVLKMWGGLGTLLGLIVGTMGTYFFTKDQVQQKDSQIRTTQAALEATQNEQAAIGKEISQVAQSTSNPILLTGKLADISKRLLREKSPNSIPHNERWNSPMYASPAPIASPPPRNLEPTMEATASPAAFVNPNRRKIPQTKLN